MELGKTFPDKAFQAEFARHLARVFVKTPWMISVDAADAEHGAVRRECRAPEAPVRRLRRLVPLPASTSEVNELNWNVMGRDRWKLAPAGGEFSYYTRDDQKNALAPDGPHGIPFEKAAAEFHITFMIGDDQPRYRAMDRIREAGMACGYRFRVVAFEASADAVAGDGHERRRRADLSRRVLAVNGTAPSESLKGLAPGRTRTDEVGAGGDSPKLTIACDRLVPGQAIEFEADLGAKPTAAGDRPQ